MLGGQTLSLFMAFGVLGLSELVKSLVFSDGPGLSKKQKKAAAGNRRSEASVFWRRGLLGETEKLEKEHRNTTTVCLHVFCIFKIMGFHFVPCCFLCFLGFGTGKKKAGRFSYEELSEAACMEEMSLEGLKHWMWSSAFQKGTSFPKDISTKVQRCCLCIELGNQCTPGAAFIQHGCWCCLWFLIQVCLRRRS